MLRIEFFYAIAFTVLSWASDPLVHLMESPQLPKGRAVYLYDVATVEGGPRELQEQLRQIELAPTAANLALQELPYLVKSQINEFKNKCNCQVQLKIPRRQNGLKHSVASSWSEENVSRAVSERVQQKCHQCQIEIKNIDLISGQVPLSYSSWSLDPMTNIIDGDMQVRIYFDHQSTPALTYQLKTNILQPGLRLKKNQVLGSVIKNQDVESVMVPWNSKPLATINEVVSFEVKKPLAEGQTIYLEDLREQWLVRAGRPVQVQVDKGLIHIEMQAIATKDARAGEWITVRIDKTQKKVVAEVVGPGKVRLQ